MCLKRLTRQCNLTPQPVTRFAINPAKPAPACYAVDCGVKHMKKSHIVTILVFLYSATFLGTWYPLQSELRESSIAGYQDSLKDKELAEKWCQEREVSHLPDAPCGQHIILLNGPNHWAYVYPVLPLISIVNSGYSASPENAMGGIEVVIWYGVGTYTLMSFNSWIA